ncbi:MAG: magnesium/cobalt transporter CorA [Bryobacteraceae bacterium]
MKWHDIADPKDTELDRLAAQYRIHPLHIEDCRHRNQRAKVEENDGYIFTVLKTVQALDDGDLAFHDLDVFLGGDWVITVQEGNQDNATKILQPIHAMEANLRADQVFYRIYDGVIDSYLPTIDRIDDVIDELEEQVLQNPTPHVLSRIFHTKGTLIDLRRVLVNTRDVTAHMYRTEHNLIQADVIPFLRDVYDHVARNLDLVETQRDLLTGTMDVYLSSVANRTNEVMKVLTVLGTIALPALVVSGFYGMNTKGLPFADSPHATAIAAGLMVATTVLLLVLLRRFRWF